MRSVATRGRKAIAAVATAEAAVAHLESIRLPADECERKGRFIGLRPGYYGQHAHYLGIPMPPIRDLAKTGALPLSEVERLLSSRYHDARALAVHCLRHTYARAKKDDDATRRHTVELVLRNVHRLNNWDLVDVCCPFVLGHFITEQVYRSSPVPVPPSSAGEGLAPFRVVCDAPYHGDSGVTGGSVQVPRIAPEEGPLAPSVETLARLIKIAPAPAVGAEANVHGYDGTVFLRRVGVVTALAFAKHAESAPAAAALAEMALGDKHDLMHKAAGWVLREVGKTAPELLRDVVDRHCTTMPRTALRYAIYFLPDDVRKAYLAGKPLPRGKPARRTTTPSNPPAKKHRSGAKTPSS